MKIYRLTTIFLALVFTLTFLGCDESSTKDDTNQTGTLNLFLTNTPADFEAVYITMDTISVHSSNSVSVTGKDAVENETEATDETDESGWYVVGAPRATMNILELSSDEIATPAGQVQLSVGDYTEIKIDVGTRSDGNSTVAEGYDTHPFANYVVLEGGAVSELEIPSYTLKINHTFSIVKNGNINMIIDFDTKNSIKQTGNGTYKLTPVIKVTTLF